MKKIINNIQALFGKSSEKEAIKSPATRINVKAAVGDSRTAFTVQAFLPDKKRTDRYSVILVEKEGLRLVPIVMGSYEAQAIAIALEKLKPHKPLIFDMTKTIIEETGYQLQEVYIDEIVNGVFEAKSILVKDAAPLIISCRPSDALALATRFDAPIFVYDKIIEEVGLMVEVDETLQSPKITII